MKTISLKQLASFNACQNKINIFKNLTGEEREITKAFVKQYYFYPWAWAGKNMLSSPAKETFAEEKAILVNQYKLDVRGKSPIEKKPFKRKLKEDIAVLFYRLYNEL